MIEYHEELPKILYGKFIGVHEACISLESNNDHDDVFERSDVKTSMSILLTENEAEKVIDWYICTQMRTTFVRVYPNGRTPESFIVDREIKDVCLYQVKDTDDYLLHVDWKAKSFTHEPDYSICSMCGDPYKLKELERIDGKLICWCCKAGKQGTREWKIKGD